MDILFSESYGPFEIVDESDRETDMRVQARRIWEIRAKAQGLVEELHSSVIPADADDVPAEAKPASDADKRA